MKEVRVKINGYANIETGVAKEAQLLNKLGFKTIDSCEGHMLRGVPSHVIFSGKKAWNTLGKWAKSEFIQPQKESDIFRKRLQNATIEIFFFVESILEGNPPSPKITIYPHYYNQTWWDNMRSKYWSYVINKMTEYSKRKDVAPISEKQLVAWKKRLLR